MYQIMFVDDEVSVANSLETILPWDTLGIEIVHKAYSGSEALELLNRHPIDIIVTDIRMPEMSGIELSETIHKRWKHKDIIFLTGHSDFDYAKHAIQIQAADYILKPVANDDLLQAIRDVIHRKEQNQLRDTAFQKAVHTLNEHLPLMQAFLLNELLQGRKYDRDILVKKLEMMKLSADWLNDSAALLLVRTENDFAKYDPYDLSLLEFSIANIADEIFSPYFQLWHGKDVHEYMVILARPNRDKIEEVLGNRADDEAIDKMLEKLALEWQKNINVYTKSSISVIISPFGSFPEELSSLYDRCMTGFRKRIGNGQELLFALTEASFEREESQVIKGITEPPLLHHLLESGKWEEAENKLNDLFNQLGGEKSGSAESMLNVYLSCASAFSYVQHKNAISYDEILQREMSRLLKQFSSAEQLRLWAMNLLGQIRISIEQDESHTRFSLIQQVQRFIANNLKHDVSLQAIADHVGLHPAYLSRIYKAVQGESLSAYLYRYRMEEAARLLTETELKIYEITEKLGYQYAPYFIKVFKQYFGVTPQEYRDKS